MEIIKAGCFSESGIVEISIPSSVISIEDNAFCWCDELMRVTFAKDSKLEKIGECCFYWSGIEEIKLPSTLKEVGDGTFNDCYSLEKIYVEDGCEASLVNTSAPY